MTFSLPSNSSINALFSDSQLNEFGEDMFSLCKELWPLNRSLTGEGNRRTLQILRREFPELQIKEVASGTQAFDWEVPLEWSIREAWIKTPDGEKICDFSKNNLSLVGYSTSVSKRVSLSELQEHLYSLPTQPEAIPYVTSYYSPHWGFCLSEKERSQLREGEYEVFIDASHFPGSLSYGEIIIPGDQASEVLLSTYICHPSMANNELSGVTLAIHLAKWLRSLPARRHTYRILFLPETIGAIVYLSNNLEHLKEHVIAGYVLTCVGDDRSYSFVPSRKGETLADKVALHVLTHLEPDFNRYTWAERQSDERQYCAPHVDLPVASIMRTKYGAYPEYHTSLDRLGSVVTPEGLSGGMRAYKRAIEILELDFYPVATIPCEPQLGKRGLYPSVSRANTYDSVTHLRNLLSYADGRMSVREISETLGIDFRELFQTALEAVSAKLLQPTASRHLDASPTATLPLRRT